MSDLDPSLLRALFVALGMAPLALVAGTVTYPHTFQDDTTAEASEVNANFATVKAEVDAHAGAIDGLVLQARRDFWRGHIHNDDQAEIEGNGVFTPRFTAIYEHAASNVVTYDSVNRHFAFSQAGLVTIDFGFAHKCAPGTSYARIQAYRDQGGGPDRFYSVVQDPGPSHWEAMHMHHKIEVDAGDTIELTVQCNSSTIEVANSDDGAVIAILWESW